MLQVKLMCQPVSVYRLHQVLETRRYPDTAIAGTCIGLDPPADKRFSPLVDSRLSLDYLNDQLAGPGSAV